MLYVELFSAHTNFWAFLSQALQLVFFASFFEPSNLIKIDNELSRSLKAQDEKLEPWAFLSSSLLSDIEHSIVEYIEGIL